MTDLILSKHQTKLKHETMAYTENRKDWSITLKARSPSGVIRISFLAGIKKTFSDNYKTCGSYIKNNYQSKEFVTRILRGIYKEQISISKHRATFHHYGLLEYSEICPLDRGVLAYCSRRACYEFPKHCGFSTDRKPEDLISKLISSKDIKITLERLTELAKILEFETQGKFPRPYDH